MPYSARVAHRAQPIRPSLAKMLGRGVRKRCALCGGRGAFFTGWFAKQETCRACGISWRRGYEGFELGAMAVSIIICFGALVSGVGLSAPSQGAARPHSNPVASHTLQSHSGRSP